MNVMSTTIQFTRCLMLKMTFSNCHSCKNTKKKRLMIVCALGEDNRSISDGSIQYEQSLPGLERVTC